MAKAAKAAQRATRAKAPAKTAARSKGPAKAATRRAKAPAAPTDRRAPGLLSAKPRRAAMRAMDAGGQGRRLASIPSAPVAINAQIRRYGASVVARSRYLALNNAYAAAARETYVSALVGTGIKPSPLVADKAIKAEIARLWRLSTDEMDADGLTDFYGMQAIIAGEMFEAGEVFVRVRRRRDADGLLVPVQLQLLPAEMLPFSHNETLPSGNRVECGIEFDAIGRRVAYWFLRSHPGDSATIRLGSAAAFGDRVRVPAAEVFHLFRPIRAGQIRGIPHTLAGITTLAMLDLYDDAELERKRTAALFAGFVTRPRSSDDEDANPFAPPTGFAGDAGASGDIALEPGAMVDLAEGQDVRFAEPADVGATYEPFQYRQLLRAAAGFGTPYADMSGDLRQTSYGSLRAGLIQFRRKIEAHQHHVMIYQFCRRVRQIWFDAAVLNGAFKTFTAAQYVADPLKFSDTKWITPKWEWIDPLKDRQAEKLAVDSGFKPRSEVIEAEGYDPEEVDARIAQDQERAESFGIGFIQLSSAVVVSPDMRDGSDGSSGSSGSDADDDSDGDEWLN